MGKRVGWFCVVPGGGSIGRHAFAHYGNYNQLLSSYCMHLTCMPSFQPLTSLQGRIAVSHHDTLKTTLHTLPAAWNTCPSSPPGKFLVIPQVPSSSRKSSLTPKATPGFRLVSCSPRTLHSPLVALAVIANRSFLCKHLFKNGPPPRSWVGHKAGDWLLLHL